MSLLFRIAPFGLALLLTFSTAGCGAATGGPSGQPSATVPPAGLVRVDRATDGNTVSAQVGDTIQIALGADLEWTVDPPAPTGILGPYAGPVTLVGGVQAHYSAVAPGTVTITASGRPRCPAYTACAQFIVSFRATVAVR